VSHVVQHFQPRKRAAAREFEVAVHYLLHDTGKLIPLMKQMAGNKWSGFIEDILNAAATRWRISPQPSPGKTFDGLNRQHWFVELLRARGGEPHSWVLEACDATGHLALPGALADGSAAADAKRIRRAG
jgi:hypothetical protein